MSSRKTLVWTAIFAISMGWLEAAVVIYLRELYYPGGFDFPLKMIEMSIGVVELLREVATILMLVAVGMLAGRTPLERFGYLMYTFGIWDIVYYIGLKASIGWPESLLTWDLLFLIPLPWIGPVLAPVLVSLAMIAACVIIVHQNDKKRPMTPGWKSWTLLILCGLIIIVSFIVDYKVAFATGAPDRFRWELFLIGYIPGVIIFFREWRKAEGV